MLVSGVPSGRGYRALYSQQCPVSGAPCSHSARFREPLLQSLCHCWCTCLMRHYAVDGKSQIAATIIKHSRCVLLRLKDHWAPRVDEREVVMLWAACCLSFFGFLRAVEVAVLYSSSVHLTVCDVAVDSLSNPSLMRVRLMRGPVPSGCGCPSREDGYRFMSYYGNAGLPRLARSRAGPLFLCSDGMPLSME